MTDFHGYHFFTLILLAVLSWTMPRQLQLSAVSLIGNIFIFWFAPIAFITLFTSSVLVYYIAQFKSRFGVWIFLGVAYCAIQLILLRFLNASIVDITSIDTLSVLGVAYFTCRNVHYLIECFKGTIRNDLHYFWIYQSFLPVFVTGPINRYPDFVREIQRRNFNRETISLAIERIIYGYAKVVIVGNYLINTKLQQQLATMDGQNSILVEWLSSLLGWAYLYSQFSGWSDIAIGFSSLIGIKVCENFNAPLKARSLIDFWQRWHISLSSWCKDYVFKPVLAITRNLFVAIIVSMIAMGLWHELSLFYILWGVYHAIGITVCRIFQQQTIQSVQIITQSFFWPFIAWFLTFGYIISGSLVIAMVERWLSWT